MKQKEQYFSTFFGKTKVYSLHGFFSFFSSGLHDGHIRFVRDDSSGSDDGDSVTFIVGGTTPQITQSSMPQYPMPTLSSISSMQTSTNSTHPHFSSTDR